MKELLLFTDGSVDSASKTGYGAFLLVAKAAVLDAFDELSGQIKVQRFEETSSTRLEVQTMLWALGEVQTTECKVTIFSDSQNIISLLGRRKGLEQNDYRSKQNRQLNNDQLYKDFFRLTDRLNCEFIKVPGHGAAHNKSIIENIFTLVDRASRKALRKNTYSSREAKDN
jgi:ribonuclease HI